ncbi:hypothetical protein GUJ93_ZPchr0013g37511 [Zizania palustris]|uniref:Uncharacterized protein n=1 Tax=Zizania palustris TaxID=103762 RepID=A0A8J5WWJ4_ZIZPA|nr:hypothetical protein GUJ93_ZPchr0013g37511 [Zizania palustris]
MLALPVRCRAVRHCRPSPRRCGLGPRASAAGRPPSLRLGGWGLHRRIQAAAARLHFFVSGSRSKTPRCQSICQANSSLWTNSEVITGKQLLRHYLRFIMNS